MANGRHARHARRDLLKQLRPFPRQTIFELHKAGGIAARLRQASNQARSDGIGNDYKHNWHGASYLVQPLHGRAAYCQNDIWRKCDQLFRFSASFFDITSAPAIVEPNVTSVRPAQFLQLLTEHGVPCLDVRFVCGARKRAYEPHALRLLSPRHQRPPCRATEPSDEGSPLHSMTSSARARSDGGTVRPSALAVLRLITNSYLVGDCTGRSPGFSP